MEFTFEKLHFFLLNFSSAIPYLSNTVVKCSKCFSVFTLNIMISSRYPEAKGRPLSTSFINCLKWGAEQDKKVVPW